MRLIGTTVYLNLVETVTWQMEGSLPAAPDYQALTIVKRAPIVVRKHDGTFAKVFWPPDYPESERVAFTERFLATPSARVLNAERDVTKALLERDHQENHVENPGQKTSQHRAKARRAGEARGKVRGGRDEG